MTPSSGSTPDSQPRAEVAPPRDPPGTLQRTGYVALAVSGLVLATAFGAVAQIMGGSETTAAGGDSSAETGHEAGGTGGDPANPEPPPGHAVPEESRAEGVAITDTAAPSATPTTVVRLGEDGQPTTTVLTPTGTDGRTSSRADPPPGSHTPPPSTPNPTDQPTETSTTSNESPTTPPSSPPSSTSSAPTESSTGPTSSASDTTSASGTGRTTSVTGSPAGP